MDELTERLTDIGNQAKEAQQYLCETAAVISSNFQADMQSQFLTIKERKDRHLFMCLRLAQIEQCQVNILKNIKAIAFAEMVRMFNEKTNGALKDIAPQVVTELAASMEREGKL